MKLSHLLAAAALSLAIASSVQAATITQHLGTVDSSTPNASSGPLSTSNEFDYSANGSLAKDTEIVFTLTSTGLTDGRIFAEGTRGNNFDEWIHSTGNLRSAGVLPVIVTSNLNAGISTITIENLTSAAKKFTATFQALIDNSKKGLFTVSYVVSAVPLPPALVMFASALILLAGFGFKKSREQA